MNLNKLKTVHTNLKIAIKHGKVASGICHLAMAILWEEVEGYSKPFYYIVPAIDIIKAGSPRNKAIWIMSII